MTTVDLHLSQTWTEDWYANETSRTTAIKRAQVVKNIWPINNHCRKLPVTDYLSVLVRLSHSICNKLQFFKNVMKILMCTTSWYRIVIIYCTWSSETGSGMNEKSLWRFFRVGAVQHERCESPRSTKKRKATYAVDPICVVEPVRPLTWRKSSSISNTLASSDFDDRSFSSSSFIRLVSIIVFLVIFLPGRDMRKIHGSHWRKTDFICREKEREIVACG